LLPTCGLHFILKAKQSGPSRSARTKSTKVDAGGGAAAERRKLFLVSLAVGEGESRHGGIADFHHESGIRYAS
jgi:hypothetical protein